MASCYSTILVFLAVLLLPALTLATIPVVTPVNGSHQVAVLPNPYTLTFTINPPVQPNNISWFYRNQLQGSVLLDDSSDPFLSFSDDRQSLNLLVPTSEGEYILQATNQDGTGSGTITLDIKSQPAFQTVPTSQIRHEYQNVTFPCFATGDPTPTIQWIYNSTLIINTTTNKYRIGQFGQSDFGSLTVFNLSFTDTGKYVCRASNVHGSLETPAVSLGVQVLPSITSQPLSIVTPAAGGVANINCKVRAFPPAYITWQKNGVNITNINSIATYSQSSSYDHSMLVTTSTLTISGPVLSTDGNYTCTGNNNLKSFETITSEESQLFVQYPPSTSASHEIVTVNQTFSTTFSCTSYGIPLPTLNWYFRGNRVQSSGQITVTNTTFTNGSDFLLRRTELNIGVSTRTLHEGNYTCIASNGITNHIGTPQNVTTELLVQVEPIIEISNRVLLGVVNRPITLNISIINASPAVLPINIQWYFNSVLINDTNNGEYVFSSDRKSLTISTLTHSNEGTYSVIVSNQAGSDTGNIGLQIEAGPVIIFPPLMITNVLQGNTAILNCTITAEPQPTIQWSKGPLSINQSPLTNISYTNGSMLREYYTTLTIYNVTMNDTGDYTCTVINTHGETNATGHIEVQVPPQITLNPMNTTSIRTHTSSLSCQSFGSPPPNITWLKGGMVINPLTTPTINITSSVEGFVRSSIIKFFNLSFNDADQYMCLAQNNLVSITSANSSVAILTVNQSPLLESTNVPNIINQTQTVNFTCSFLGLPPPSIRWSRSDFNSLTDTSRFNIFTNQVSPPNGGILTTSILQVSNVGENDTGNYTCIGSNAPYEGENSVNMSSFTFPVLVQTSPIVTRDTSDLVIGVFTRSIVLSFRVSRDTPDVEPSRDLHWFFNGNEINPLNNKYTFSSDRLSLNISNLTLSDEGSYTLVASNIIGSGNDSIFVDVEVSPVITGDSGTVNIVQGENATLHCAAVSEPVHITSWSFNGTLIATNTSKYTIYGNNTVNSSLIVTNVSLSDEGRYTCRASNVHGDDRAMPLLQVQVPPIITRAPTDTITLVNNLTTLLCCASGRPLPYITWFKNGSDISSISSLLITSNSQQEEGINCSTLTIQKPVFTDRGDYSCQAVNFLAETKTVSSQVATLTVQYPPQVYPTTQETYTVNQSDSFTIQCQAFGLPVPTIYWLPGPINVTNNIGNGNKSLLNSQLNTLRSRVSYSSRLFGLSNQCPLNGGLSQCSHDMNITNDCSYNGSLCNVPCGVIITNSYDSQDDLGRPLVVSTLTLCNVLKSDELSYTCLAVNNITNTINTPEAVSANLIVQVPPAVQSAHTDDSQIAFRGHNTTLHFNITGSDPDVLPENIKWSFNHRFHSNQDIANIETGSGNHFIFSSNRRSLTIVNLTTDNTGTYTLTASNPSGTTRGTVDLLVQALPEIQLFSTGPIITTTGNTVMLDCFADGSPLQNVSWSFTSNSSGQQIWEIQFIITNETARTGESQYMPLVSDLTEESLSSRFIISDNTNSSDRQYGRLTIQNITAYDAGTYQCTLINEFNINNPERRSVQVQVQLNPSIVQSPSLLTNCTAGGSCTLNCTVSGVPAPTVTWYHNQQLLPASLSTYNSTYDSTVSQLTIRNVGLSNTGSYYCIGRNVLYTNSSDVSLNGNITILYPPEVIEPPSNTIVNETYNTMLYCTITGFPTPTIQWLIIDSIININNSNSKYNVTVMKTCTELLCNVTSSLLIVNATKRDESMYRCTGTNGVTNMINVQSAAAARLTVQVPPTIIRAGSTSTTDVIKGSNLIISFNITRASPLVDISNIIWSFRDLRNNSTVLNVSCAEEGGVTCSDSQRYSRYNFTFDSLGTSLEIRNAQVMDFGQYSVTVQNPAGISVEIHNLIVNVSAQLSAVTNTANKLYNFTRDLGQTVNISLNCTADGIPPPNILWFLSTTIVSETRRIRISQSSINTRYRPDVALHPNDTSVISVLSIENADPLSDAGFYTCEADNRVGQPSLLTPPFRVIINVETIDHCLSSPCQNGGTCFNRDNGFFCECGRVGNVIYDGRLCQEINRIPIPPVFRQVPQAQFIRLFDRVVLHCSANGEPTPTITWFKISNNSNVGDPIPDAVGSQSFSYIIPEVTLSNRGRYYCTARNANGQIRSDAVLVNIIDVVEYDANLTVTIDRLFTGTNRITRNVTTAVNDIVTEINRVNAGNKVDDNSTVFFIERSGAPVNLTANFTLPIRVTIRILQGRMVDDALTRTVENAVAMFGYQLDINSVVTIFNYCPRDVTIIPSPNGNPLLALTINWPRQILGLTQSVNCPCDFQLSSTALVATRNCTGDFNSGASWERPDIRACNFSVPTRELCRLANLSSSAILDGLDRITGRDTIDTAGTTVTSFAIEQVESDIMDNMTLVNTSMNVFNNILGVNSTVLEMAQTSSGSSTRMQNSLFNITRGLPPNTTIMRDRMMITTGNSTPSTLTSDITTGNSSQETNFTGSSLSINLPPELTDTEGIYSLTAFANDGLFLPRSGRANVVTPVIDFTLERANGGGNNFTNLERPVVINFNSLPREMLEDRNFVPRCVFWDINEEDWSSVGCTKNGSSCMCNHLTSFAILLDVAAEEPRTSPEDEAFEYITYIGLTLSTVSLIITLITYLGSPKLRSSEASQLLINLCFALLGLYITFIIAGQGVKLTKPICGIIGALVHYFFLAVFFIMAAESIDLFIKLVIVLGPKIHKFILKTIIIAWIAPLFFVLFSFVPNYEHYVSGHFCGPTQVPLYVGMMLPFLIIYIFNWTIFCIIMISLLRKSASSKFNEAKKKNRKAEVKQQCRVAFTVSVLFGLGWGFGLLSTQAIQVTAIRIIFNPIFTVLTVFQGFFIFLLYVLLSANARKVWKRWILRKEDKPGVSTSSTGPSTTRSTKNTSLPPKKSSRYGNAARTGTLYKNVYSAAGRKTSSPFVTRDLISSDLESAAGPLMEELKGKLQFRSLDSDDDRIFMNPLDDLGDVMSLVSDNGSLLGETTFSFPNPNPLEFDRNSQEEEEEEGEEEMANVEEGKCSTFKNPLRTTVRRKMSPKELEETELLSGNTIDEEPSGVAMVTLNLNDINGFSMMSDEFSPSLSLSPGNGGVEGSYSQSQGLSANDGSLLIKDSQVPKL